MIDIPELKNTIKVSETGSIGNFLEEDRESTISSINTRRIKYPIPYTEVNGSKSLSRELRSKGWLKLEGALSHKEYILNEISKKLNHILDGGRLDIDSNLGRQVGEHGFNTMNQSEARNNQLFLSVPEPLYNVPEISEIIFDDALVNVAKSFFECMPAIGTLNLRKSFANNLQSDNTTLYHVDPNALYFFKAFVYLKDVDSVEDGPFTYIEGSVDEKPQDLTDRYRWQDEEIETFYGKQRVKHLTGKKGDVIFAMTNGFHKGQKCVRTDRELLTIDFVSHPDSWQAKKQMLIKEDTFLNMPRNKIPLTDFLYIRR